MPLAFTAPFPCKPRRRLRSESHLVPICLSDAHSSSAVTKPVPPPARLPTLPARPFILHTQISNLDPDVAQSLIQRDGVWRCDVFREIAKRKKSREAGVHVWTLYEHASYAQLHPAPGGFVQVLQPVYPAAQTWQWDGDDDGERARVALSLMGLGMKENKEPGVTVVMARAKVLKKDFLPGLMGILERYIEDEEMIWGGILMGKEDEVVVLTVHDEGEALFDAELAGDLVQRWEIKRFEGVFPGRGGWEKDEYEVGQEKGFLKESVPFEYGGIAVREESGLAQKEEEVHTRLVQGPSAFDKVGKLLREMAGDKDDVKVLIIAGWNASRAGVLLNSMEERKGVEAKFRFRFGVSVQKMDTEELRIGCEEIREYEPDVVVGFGGGAVMDMVKMMGAIGRLEETEVEELLKKIDEAGKGAKVELDLKGKADGVVPVMLIPGNVGSGCELVEICVIKGNKGGRVVMRMNNAERKAMERVVMVDSRLVGPSRLIGKDAAQGALQVVCRGMEILMCVAAAEGVEWAKQAVTEASEGVLPAFREPMKSTGASRDALVNAKTRVGMAADYLGRVGLCSRIALAVLDELVDGPGSGYFRMVLIRVTAAVVDQLVEWGSREAEEIREAYLVKTREHISERLLQRAEDTDVWLLREMGMVRRSVPSIAEVVVRGLEGEELKSDVEHAFQDVEVVQRILYNALDQQYEL